MSEDRSGYGQVISEAQAAIAEISGYYAIIPEELLYCGNHSAVILYGVLDRIASKGEGYASLTKLAERAGMSQATIRRARNFLVDNGWIEVTRLGSGRMATDYSLPFQTNKRRGSKPDTPGVASETYLTETSKPESNNPETNKENGHQPLLDLTVHPVWYGIANTVPRWTVKFADAEKWRVEAKVSEDLAELKAYALRDWWPRQPKKRREEGDPYATWQNWCRQDRDKAPDGTLAERQRRMERRVGPVNPVESV